MRSNVKEVKCFAKYFLAVAYLRDLATSLIQTFCTFEIMDFHAILHENIQQIRQAKIDILLVPSFYSSFNKETLQKSKSVLTCFCAASSFSPISSIGVKYNCSRKMATKVQQTDEGHLRKPSSLHRYKPLPLLLLDKEEDEISEEVVRRCAIKKIDSIINSLPGQRREMEIRKQVLLNAHIRSINTVLRKNEPSSSKDEGERRQLKERGLRVEEEDVDPQSHQKFAQSPEVSAATEHLRQSKPPGGNQAVANEKSSISLRCLRDLFCLRRAS